MFNRNLKRYRMVSRKGKRKIEYNGQIFFWFVRTDNTKSKRIHILSDDKRTHLEYPFFDSEVPVTPSYIKHLLEDEAGQNTSHKAGQNTPHKAGQRKSGHAGECDRLFPS